MHSRDFAFRSALAKWNCPLSLVRFPALESSDLTGSICTSGSERIPRRVVDSARIARLRAQGLSWAEIGKQVG